MSQNIIRARTNVFSWSKFHDGRTNFKIRCNDSVIASLSKATAMCGTSMMMGRLTQAGLLVQAGYLSKYGPLYVFLVDYHSSEWWVNGGVVGRGRMRGRQTTLGGKLENAVGKQVEMKR